MVLIPDWFWSIWDFASHRRTRYVAAWVAALISAAVAHYFAYQNFQTRKWQPLEERRIDGNSGHVTIDFGGQWLMARMLVRGYGRDLYHRHRQYEVAWQAYPRESEAPAAKSHDADDLIGCFMIVEDDAELRNRLFWANTTRTAVALPLGAGDPLQAFVLMRALQDPNWTPPRPDSGPLADRRGPLTPMAIEEIHLRDIGGPLYPPIQALIYAPLALDDRPQRAYRIMQVLMLSMAFIGGLGVSVFTRGRIWWPIASMMILFFPGFRGGHHLGQNAPLSLAILIWGWALIHRRHELAGGALWGLLAFKPTIAMAFFLVPLLTRRWKAAIAMAASGIGLALATLPFVGFECWLDWFRVGSVGNSTYNVDENWIFLSRDLLSIPRRFLVDFSGGYPTRDRWYLHVAGWGLWLFVVEATLRVAVLRRDHVRLAGGPAAACVLLGAWASCFHFMYYDVLLSFLGMLALLMEPDNLVRQVPDRLLTQGVNAANLAPSVIQYFEPRLAQTHPDLVNTDRRLPVVLTANSFRLYALVVLLMIQHLLPWMNLSATVVAAGWFHPVDKTSRVGDSTEIVRQSTTKSVYKDDEAMTVLETTTKPSEHTPKLEFTTNTIGPPWDTFALIVIWGWCVVMAVRPRVPPPCNNSETAQNDKT